VAEKRIFIFVDPLMSFVEQKPSSNAGSRVRRPFLPERLDKLHKKSEVVSVYEQQWAVKPIDISDASHLLVGLSESNPGRNNDRWMVISDSGYRKRHLAS